MARGMAEVSASSLEEQFSQIDHEGTDLEVEARLAALKGKSLGSGAPALGAGETGSWSTTGDAHGRGRTHGPFFMPDCLGERLRLRPPARSRFG